jgi:hypothetical protein
MEKLKLYEELTQERDELYQKILSRVREANKKSKISNICTLLISALLIFNVSLSIKIINAKDEKIEELTKKYEELKSEKEEINTNINFEASWINATQTKTDVSTTVPEKFNSVPLDNELKKYIYKSAVDAKIPVEIMFAMAWKESTFNPNAKSSTDDHGLFQINRINFERMAAKFGYTYEEICNKIYDPYVNTDCAVSIIKEYRDNYTNDNWHHVLMRYNMGPGKATSLFNSGVYSSQYSRAIISYAKNNFGFNDIVVAKK